MQNAKSGKHYERWYFQQNPPPIRCNTVDIFYREQNALKMLRYEKEREQQRLQSKQQRREDFQHNQILHNLQGDIVHNIVEPVWNFMTSGMKWGNAYWLRSKIIEIIDVI